MNDHEPWLLRTFRTAERLPLGRRLFSQAFRWAAPYFRTIPVKVVSAEPGRTVAQMQDRWRVHNHLGTVHAIALCNLAEFTMGVTAETTVPTTHRWIPKSMQVEYKAKARGLMTATATLQLPEPMPDKQEFPVEVAVNDPAGTEVFHARINLWITRKPARETAR